MSQACTLVINGQAVSARKGASLVDAALSNGIAIPVDCCSGQCDTCRVRVVSGAVDDAGTASGDTVLACQATVAGSSEIIFEAPLPVQKRIGIVEALRPLAPEIVEVAIRIDEPLSYRPGQYLKARFPNCPIRDYSPTAATDGSPDSGVIYFQIRLYSQGAVSSALRTKIRRGDRVRLEGPYGSSYYRTGNKRLVLVGTNTGWAPLWSIARAARRDEPHRSLQVIVGARDPRHLYMRDALHWIRQSGVANITLCSTGDCHSLADVEPGRPTDHLGSLRADDVVYAAGAPAMVDAVRAAATRIGAICYTDPFTIGNQPPSLFGRLLQAIDSGDESRIQADPNATEQAAPSERSNRGSVSPPIESPQKASRVSALTRWLARS